MRTPRNDAVAGTYPSPSGEGLTVARPTGAPERRCILSGAHGARAQLIRLAIAPDGAVVPDVLARAPGRGAWIGVSRETLEIAMAKGKLKGALARAFKGARLAIPADLPDRIEAAFARTFLSQIGMAAKAGVLLTGAEKVDAAARGGAVALLGHAADAAEDGRRKRDQSWRVGEDEEGSGRRGRILPVDRAALSAALGRDNAVHVAVVDPAWGERLNVLLDRWQDFAGWARDGAPQSLPVEDSNAVRSPGDKKAFRSADDAAV